MRLCELKVIAPGNVSEELTISELLVKKELDQFLLTVALSVTAFILYYKYFLYLGTMKNTWVNTELNQT